MPTGNQFYLPDLENKKVKNYTSNKKKMRSYVYI
jgi:hypothetical protein